MHKFFVSRTLAYGFRHPKMYITLRPFGASPLERGKGSVTPLENPSASEVAGPDTPLAPLKGRRACGRRVAFIVG